MPTKPFRDLIGHRYTRWLVLSYAGRSRYGNHQWFCMCDCGVAKLVPDYTLILGKSKSCGCYRVDYGKFVAEKGGTAVVKTHGKRQTIEYMTWCGIKRRTNLDHAKPSSYALQGITICERWANSFEAFLEDMGPRPSTDHSIDRIDYLGNYDPGNCRWATKMEQASNKSNNRWLEYAGETKHLSEWARIFGLGVGTLHARLNKSGWSVEKALTTPIKKHRCP